MKAVMPKMSRWRNNEHNHFCDWTKQAIVKHGADKLHIEPLYQEFSKLFAQESDANKEADQSNDTQKILTKDDYRDRIFRATNLFIAGGALHFVEEIVEAGKVLENISHKYGNLAEKPLAEETISIKNFIGDLEAKSELVAKIPGLTEILGELKRANIDVDKLMVERKNENAHKKSVAVKVIRVKMDAVIGDIVSAVNVFAKLSPSAAITEFIEEHNASVKRAEDIVARRLGKKSGYKNPENDDSDNEPVDYPDAKEWEEDLPFMGVENGDIYYILVAGKKVFYKLVDKNSFFDSPDSAKGASGWEKLS